MLKPCVFGDIPGRHLACELGLSSPLNYPWRVTKPKQEERRVTFGRDAVSVAAEFVGTIGLIMNKTTTHPGVRFRHGHYIILKVTVPTLQEQLAFIKTQLTLSSRIDHDHSSRGNARSTWTKFTEVFRKIMMHQELGTVERHLPAPERSLDRHNLFVAQPKIPIPIAGRRKSPMGRCFLLKHCHRVVCRRVINHRAIVEYPTMMA